MMVDELKDICRSFTISGFAGKNKEAIIKLIIDRYASNSPPQPSMDILEDIYTIPMLKDLCKLFGVTKYANLNRPQLLDHFVRTMSGPLRITGAMGQVLNSR